MPHIDPRIDPRRLAPRRIRLEATVASACALLVVLLGPRVQVDETLQPVTVHEDVDGWLAEREAGVADLRPGEQKEVVWADSAGHRTPLAVVYLHGFSADRHELDPVPRMLADSLGANLFYTRFAGHGRDGASLAEASAQSWFQDVAEAVAVGKRLGDRVILMGTSTGGTLATWAAGNPELRDDVAALLLVSPNFQPRDRRSRLLLWPWGGAMARVFSGRERCWEAANEEQERHWDTCYPTAALLPLMGLVERVRTMDLSQVTAPTLILFSGGDRVVDPEVTMAHFQRLGGVPKRLLPFTQSRTEDQHILAGDIMSPGTNDALVGEMLRFLAGADLGSP